MKPGLRIIIVILSLFFLNCSEEPTEPTGDFDVSGRVLSKGVAVENAIVKLDNSENLKTATDKDGYFKLLNVPKGNYDLIVSKNTVDGSFSERTTSIAIDSDLNLDNLILPKGIKVYEPNSVTDKTLLLSWSPTDASDFREYKVYKHTTSGLDETTGTLMHVSTSINDTVFQVPDLNPLEEYFFRVYVMNDFGRLGGSNIVSVKTENSLILKNGSFEILDPSTGYPNAWKDDDGVFGRYWLVDSSVVQNGKYSLSVHDQSGVLMPYQPISPSDLIAGSRYKLTYWIKHDALQAGREFAIFMDNTEFTWHIQINQVSGPAPASDWKEYTHEFTMPSVEASNFNIRLYFLLDQDTYAWVDNMSLIKVE